MRRTSQAESAVRGIAACRRCGAVERGSPVAASLDPGRDFAEAFVFGMARPSSERCGGCGGSEVLRLVVYESGRPQGSSGADAAAGEEGA